MFELRPFPVLVFLITAAALAQQPAPTPPQSRLASFNIVALDTRGRPITDLHPGDLKIEDDGKSQPLTFFRSNGVEGALPEPLKTGEYSNAVAPAFNTTVILFDLLNEGIGASSSATNDLITALQHAESPEHIALFILTRDGKFFTVHDLEAGAPATGAAPWTSTIRPTLEKAMNDVIGHRNGDDRATVTRATDTFNLIGRLTYRMGSLPGRKTLIWITAGVPLQMRINGEVVNFEPPLQRMAAGMNQANITAYTVRQSVAGAGEALGTENSASLETFAQLTGGRAYASDYVGQALTDTATDARATYRAGFYPPANYWNDKFHKLRVTSSRPDVRLRAISGFTALAKDPNTADDVTKLTSPNTLPADLNEIGLRAAVSPGATAGMLHFQISLNPADVPFEPTGDKFLSQFSLAFLKYGEKPPAAPQTITTPMALRLSLTREQMDQAAHKPIGFPEDVAVAASVRAVRLVIYNRAANEYGTLTVPVNPQ